jgi:hypothetical protein
MDLNGRCSELLSSAMTWWVEFLAAFLANVKPVADLVQVTLTCLGILVGSWWVLRKREQFPRATISLRIQRIALIEGKYLVRVETTVANVGQVMICLQNCQVRLQQIRPFDPSILINPDGTLVRCGREGAWPTIDELHCKFEEKEAEIEPGESQSFEHDFLVDSAVEAIQAYSYFQNIEKKGREIGWNSTTVSAFCKRGDEMPEQTESKPQTGTVERQLAPKPSTALVTPLVSPTPVNPNVIVQLPPKPATPVIQPKKSS